MGMYDNIVGVPEVKCECGAIVKGWQSKDSVCLLKQVHFSRVFTFYADCNNCGRWHEFDRPFVATEYTELTEPLEGGPKFEDFERSVRENPHFKKLS